MIPRYYSIVFKYECNTVVTTAYFYSPYLPHIVCRAGLPVALVQCIKKVFHSEKSVPHPHPLLVRNVDLRYYIEKNVKCSDDIYCNGIIHILYFDIGVQFQFESSWHIYRTNDEAPRRLYLQRLIPTHLHIVRETVHSV
jgi:hypothetical protein